MKRFMDFLFGKKYPIFNKKGEIEHHRKQSFKDWSLSYKKNPNKNWKKP